MQNPILADVDKSISERLGDMKPLVKAGRIIFFLNETTGDYALYDESDPITFKTTDGDKTTMTYYGQGGYVSLDLTYKRGTNELLKCAFTTYGDEGHLGEIRHYYGDTDGDGRFDRFSDREAGKFYEQKDMQWVLIDSAQLKDK